jgi:hypothetical protein
MPEEPEVETDRLHEAIHEELEHEGGDFLKRIALTTAVLAAFAAIAALHAGSTVNEALVLKTEATRLQAEASDQWTYYQAKGLKSEIQEASRGAWLAAGKEPPERFTSEEKRYKAEQLTIKAAAEKKEHERDEKSEAADHLLHHHHLFADAVALFQVAIALGAVAALTRSRWVWITSMIVGLGGIIVATYAYMMLH